MRRKLEPQTQEPEDTLAGEELRALLKALAPSPSSLFAHQQSTALPAQIGQVLMRRKLKPEVTTTEEFPGI